MQIKIKLNYGKEGSDWQRRSVRRLRRYNPRKSGGIWKRRHRLLRQAIQGNVRRSAGLRARPSPTLCSNVSSFSPSPPLIFSLPMLLLSLSPFPFPFFCYSLKHEWWYYECKWDSSFCLENETTVRMRKARRALRLILPFLNKHIKISNLCVVMINENFDSFPLTKAFSSLSPPAISTDFN